MKTATFTYIDPKAKSIQIRGSITIKNDGKASISLIDASMHSISSRYMAKNLAKKIVEANFQHPAVTSFKEDSESLIKLIKEHTEDLRFEYIDRCKKFEEKRFENSKKWLASLSERETKAWFDYFNIEVEQKAFGIQKHWTLIGNYDNRKAYSEAKNKIEEYGSYIKTGKQKAIDKAEYLANMHYEISTHKLARRIEEKGLNINSLEITRKQIGVNLEITFSDGTLR